jgi:HK97 family phage portal protein
MMHIPAFSLDGINGLSPVRMGANIMGSAMAADETSAGMFKNAMKSPGLVTMDTVFKPDQREEVRKHVKSVSDSGGYMVLEKGASFQQLNMNPQDAELLASRGFNVEELCRWFRVPPFMVGHSEKSTSWGTGIEQQMIGFLTFSLRPWLARIEQSINKCLLTPAEQTRYFAEFALEGLLRADSASRASFYSTMVQNGIYTRDDVRGLENQPKKGGNADVLTVQSNLVPIDKLGETPDATGAQNALKQWLGLSGKDYE